MLGVLTLARLPEHDSLKYYDARCSRDHFGVLATCREESIGELTSFFEKAGGEARHLTGDPE